MPDIIDSTLPYLVKVVFVPDRVGAGTVIGDIPSCTGAGVVTAACRLVSRLGVWVN